MEKKQEREKFNKFAGHPLQTWEWGEFRKEWGNEIARINYKSGSKTNYLLITFSKIPHTPLKIGACLKGPKPTKEMLDQLKKLGKENKAIFIKLEPNIIVNSKIKPQKSKLQIKNKNKVIKLLKENYCAPGKTLFTPTTFWIDLTKQEDELLKSFSSKTRYNIRLAQKRGVEVVEDDSKRAFEKYIALTKETIKRQGFYAHNEQYHRLMWNNLNEKLKARKEKPIARLLTAKYHGKTITAWILFVWKDFIYYPYGASSDRYKNVMANNLIMWEAIRLGKKLGCKTFDLWGREPGKGFTRFKEGYHPQVVEFLGSWDLIINRFLYWPYRLAEPIRWFLLRIPTKLGIIKPRF